MYDHRGRVTFSRRGDKVKIYAHRVSAPVLQGVRLGNAWYVEGPIVSQSMPGAKPKQAPKCLVCSGSFSYSLPAVFAVQGADMSKASGSWQVWHARLGHVG